MDINIGKILIQPKDTWISTQAYEYLNLVRYNKNLYICKSVTGAPVGTLPTNTSYYMHITADGIDAQEIQLQKTATEIQWKRTGDITWTTLVVLSAIKGDKGDPGPKGDQGDPGTDGITWFMGTKNPTTEGVDGDLYLNYTTWHVWGKISGTWTDKGTIQGADGEGAGDVVGPVSAVDSNFAVFDGITGKLLKDSGKAIADFAGATHPHAIADVTNLQTTLDGKAASSHNHAGVYLDKSTNFTKTSGQIIMHESISGFNSSLNAVTGMLGTIWDSQLDDNANCAMIGFPHNRMAYLTKRGGSVSASPNFSSGLAENLFEGSGAYVYWTNPSGNIVLTITLPTAWSYMRMFMMQFYGTYYPTSFLVEYSKDGGATWATGFDITGWTRSYFCAPTGSPWYATNVIRITFRAYNTTSYFHIYEIGWWSAGEPIDSYSLSKTNGGDVYGDINLPTGKHYKINGVPLDAADVGASALAHNHTGVYSPVDHTHSNYLTDLSGDTTPELSGALDCNNKPVYWDIYTISGTSIDVANGNKQQLTLSTTNITVSLSTPSGACAFHLFIYQGATARTITWPTIKWLGGTAPNLAVSNGRFVVCLAWDGASWFGSWGAYS